MKQLFSCIFVLSLFGCQGFEGKARTRIGFSKLTGSGYVDSSRDDDVSIGLLKGNGATSTQPGGFEARDVKIISNASNVNPTIANLVDANTRLVKQYGDNFVAGTDAVFNGLSKIAQIAMPVIGQAVTGHYNVAAMKAQKPTMASELINAIGGGMVGPLEAKRVMESLPIDIESDVLNNPIVKARFAEMEAELKRLREAAPAPTE